MKPRVSVVVPVRNRRDLLRELLDGLALQTYTDFEVVIVDDGSSDGSAEEAEQEAIQGWPVRVLRLDGRGAVRSRQEGVHVAVGEVLAFTDSDCVPEPGWLEAGVTAIDHGADVVQGHTRSARRRRPLERSLWVEDDTLYETCNVFYRRSAFEAAGGFDGDVGSRYGFRAGRRARGLGFGEDALLGWRVRRAGRAVYEPNAVVRHHVFPPDVRDQLSRTLQAGAFPGLIREVPELRTTFLTRRVFLGTSRVPLYAALVSVAVRRPALSVALVGYWVRRHWVAISKLEPSRKARLCVLPAVLATDALTGAALVGGSLRARSVVL